MLVLVFNSASTLRTSTFWLAVPATAVVPEPVALITIFVSLELDKAFTATSSPTLIVSKPFTEAKSSPVITFTAFATPIAVVPEPAAETATLVIFELSVAFATKSPATERLDLLFPPIVALVLLVITFAPIKAATAVVPEPATLKEVATISELLVAVALKPLPSSWASVIVVLIFAFSATSTLVMPETIPRFRASIPAAAVVPEPAIAEVIAYIFVLLEALTAIAPAIKSSVLFVSSDTLNLAVERESIVFATIAPAPALVPEPAATKRVEIYWL